MALPKKKYYNGVITFFGSHHAMKAKRILTKHHIAVKVIPGPREISPNCGIAIAIFYKDIDDISSCFNIEKVKYEAFHHMIVDWL